MSVLFSPNHFSDFKPQADLLEGLLRLAFCWESWWEASVFQNNLDCANIVTLLVEIWVVPPNGDHSYWFFYRHRQDFKTWPLKVDRIRTICIAKVGKPPHGRESILSLSL
jgi:hypothetical protein